MMVQRGEVIGQPRGEVIDRTAERKCVILEDADLECLHQTHGQQRIERSRPDKRLHSSLGSK